MGRKQKGLLYALAAAFFFCFTEVCMKKIGGQLGGIQVTFSRYILAGILLLPLARRELRRRHTSVSLAQFWEMNLLGLWGVVLVAPFYQTGTVMLGAGISSVLFSINPLCVALMAALLLGEPVRVAEKPGVALQVIGIFCAGKSPGKLPGPRWPFDTIPFRVLLFPLCSARETAFLGTGELGNDLRRFFVRRGANGYIGGVNTYLHRQFFPAAA